VQATDGTVMPLRELCALARERGVFTIVDGALGPGHLDVQFADIGCDAYATAFHRWLKRLVGHRRAVPAARRAAAGLARCRAAGRDAGAQGRYGASSRHLGPAIEGVEAALEFQQVVNRARIHARIREFAAYLRMQLGSLPGVEVLTPTHPSLAHGVISLRLPRGEHAAAARALAAEDGRRARPRGAGDVRRAAHQPPPRQRCRATRPLLNALRRRL